MRKAVVMLSGGMDSTTVVAIARSLGYELFLLHTNYGQLTETREFRAFCDIANFYHIPEDHRLVVSIEHLRKIGGSALTDPKIAVPEADINRKEVPLTYVPARNTNLLAIATSWAEVIKASAIFIGANELDSSGYCDCREVYYEAYNNLLKYAVNPDVSIKVETPLIRMTKREIVLRGIELKAPLHLTWSCYQDEDTACGECDSCALRLRGFREAGVIDPIPYKDNSVRTLY